MLVSRWVRGVMGVLAVGALGVCVREAALLYSDAAPFHQMYNQATAAQDRMVSARLWAALVGLPVALTVAAAAVFWLAVRARPRLWVCMLGVVLLLSGLQGFGVSMLLPYGFGSGYEHASAAQREHLRLSRWIGLGSIAGAIVVLRGSTWVRANRRDGGNNEEPILS